MILTIEELIKAGRQIEAAQEIGKCNAHNAVDQCHDYGNRDDALDAYRANVFDTLCEFGLRRYVEVALRAFTAEIKAVKYWPRKRSRAA